MARLSMRRALGLGPFLALASSSCLFDSGPEPRRAPVEFLSLAIPAEIVLGVADRLDVSFRVGPNGCWNLESLSVRREGSVLHVDGVARMPDPGAICTDAVVYGRATVTLPIVEPGVYVVRAGELFQNVTVTEASSGARDRFAYLGPVSADDAGCALEGHSELTVALSGLPANLPGGEYLVRGEVTGADPCRYTDLPSLRIDYFVTVDEVVPAPED